MKKALIIGGSSAIGSAIIDKFMAEDYEVVFTYGSSSEKAASICDKWGAQCHAQHVDLSSMDNVEQFLEKLKDQAAPDVLVNVAGITHDSLSVGSIGHDLQKVTSINYLAPATICAGIAELMMPRRKGAIINISSIASRTPRAGNAAYGSAKYALERFTATLALEVARFKVRTICIAPAFVDTPMFQAFAKGNEKKIIRDFPLKEILDPDDVANAVMAFVSGNIKTTGVTLHLTNGSPIL